MTLRTRLTVWYGALCALALVGLGFVGYSTTVREQYRTLDRVLLVTARIVETGIRKDGRSYFFETDTSTPTRDGIVMVLRSYSEKGELMYSSPNDPGLKPTQPQAPLSSPAPPASLKVLPLPWPAPAQVQPGANGAFGILSFEGQRWRRYVVRVDKGPQVLGYVEALTPLGRLDTESLRLARLLLNLTLLSVLTVLLVGWWIAGVGLRPVDQLTRAARTIAHSRDLRQRVPTRGERDELGRLALTFNEMLGSLESAWKSQQRFVGDASHELRAPLTVMRGNLELLRRHPHLGPDERDAMIAEIERETSRMTRLVEDLLLLARSDAGSTLTRTPVDLRAPLLEALRDARTLARHHHLTLDAPPGPLTVLGERDRLRQLLLILLDNALKYSPDGSTVRVQVLREAGQITVLIHDEGDGIPESALPHIFERFYRADAARQRDTGGTGLGLAIAAWIATQLGARIAVHETGPGGTTFGLTFSPLPAPQTQDPERTPVLEPSA